MVSARSSLFGSVFAFVAAFAALVSLVVLVPVTAHAQARDPGRFVQELGDKAIAQLAGQQIPESEERARFKALLTQYFDTNAIGKFTVGRAYWGTATPQQQQELRERWDRLIEAIEDLEWGRIRITRRA